MIYHKRTSLLFGSLFFLVACISNQPSTDNDNKKSLKNVPSALETPWRSLLDDKTLSQWQQLGGKAPYHLEDDTIIGTTIPTNQNSFLTTKEIFGDFIFEVGVNVDAGMNSGVQFRSNSLPSYNNGRVHGYQMEIDTSSRKWSGGIFDEARSGWIYNLSRNTKCQNEFKVDNWNTYRIEAIGNNLRTFINGVPCADLIDEQSASGFIALQVHSAGKAAEGKQVKWRNPRIITENLSQFVSPKATDHLQFSMLKNQLTADEKKQQWQLLWDGSAANIKNTKAWQVKEDSMLNNEAAELWYDIPFDNFELTLDVKIGDNLNGEIYYLLPDQAIPDNSLSFKLSDDTLNPAAKDKKQSLGAITQQQAPVNQSEPGRKAKREKGKWGWNRIRIVVEHGKAQHWMNNVKIAETTLTAEQKIKTSKLKIAVHQGSINIRNIKLRKTTSNPGDRAGHEMKEVVPRELIPEAPILNIEQALASFKIHPEFKLEVVANEPLIFDPVVALYDPAGRIWALEMTTYMLDTQAKGEMAHESQIVVLTDTDNDGKMDKRQVVLEKILLPRALAFVEGGILWADNEKLYFSEISENKGEISVTKTEVVDATYAKGGNIEHKPNALLYSLDNWYYNAKSYQRYRPYPLNQALPNEAKEIYRNQHWKMAKAGTEYRGQWGLSQDDYGRHYFNFNWTPLQTTSFLPNVATRNPKHKFSESLMLQNVGTNDVYPARVTPGINRGYMKDAYTEDYKLKTHTAACGPLIYRGDQFPAQYYGMGLVQEPAANLIKATLLSEEDGVVTGGNLFDKQEIIASTDERFRPVNAINAPDGTATVIDFYHGILQHRTFLTSYLSDQIKMRDLERSKHIGRLYRLKHKDSPTKKVTYLDNLSAIELVPYLAHSNGWHRDTAQQLLVMMQDSSAIPALKEIAKSSTNHLAQIKALWTLEGVGVVDFSVLKAAVLSNHNHSHSNKVKRSVYRLAELLPQATPEITQWLLAEAKSANPETAPILSLTVAQFNVWPALSELINQFGTNDFTYAALAHKEAIYLAAEKNNITESVITNISVVMNTNLENKQKKYLKGDTLISYGRGKALYNGEAGCFGCHGTDGAGNQTIPPLDKSEWVTENKNRLAAIMLRGLSGPITVNNKDFNSPMTMPGLAGNHEFSDQKLADIATFIRNAWRNSAKGVSANDVKNIREQTQLQAVPFTVNTLNAQFKQ